MPDQPISELASILMEREMQRDPEQFRAPENPAPAPREGGMSPLNLSTLASIADVAGTYAGMKRGLGKEGNPLVTAYAGQNPEKLALMAIPQILGVRALHGLISKKSPALADALAANLAGTQMSLASDWARINMKQRDPRDGLGAYSDRMTFANMREAERIHQGK